jgi:hypothetical protein
VTLGKRTAFPCVAFALFSLTALSVYRYAATEASESRLIYAVKHKEHAHVVQLLDAGVRCNLRDTSPQTYKNPMEAVEALFRRRTAPGSAPTILMRAIEERDPIIVGHLLDHGADPNATAQSSAQTPLIWAAEIDGEDGPVPNTIIDNLIDHGARIDYQDMDGMTPLMWAALAGNGTTVGSLLRRGANFEIRDKLNEECVTLLKQAMRPHDAARRLERR